MAVEETVVAEAKVETEGVDPKQLLETNKTDKREKETKIPGYTSIKMLTGPSSIESLSLKTLSLKLCQQKKRCSSSQRRKTSRQKCNSWMLKSTRLETKSKMPRTSTPLL